MISRFDGNIIPIYQGYGVLLSIHQNFNISISEKYVEKLKMLRFTASNFLIFSFELFCNFLWDLYSKENIFNYRTQSIKNSLHFRNVNSWTQEYYDFSIVDKLSGKFSNLVNKSQNQDGDILTLFWNRKNLQTFGANGDKFVTVVFSLLICAFRECTV